MESDLIEYFKIDVKLEPKEINPYSFIGSTLRGAFGVALKRVVCINPAFKCEGCFASKNCIYYDFFEKKDITHKFCFDFELNPKNYDFSLFLFEEASEYLPYVVSAIYKMLVEIGLTKNREKFKIQEIICNDELIFKDEKFDLSGVNKREFEFKELDKNIDSLKIILKTPLRIKHQGKLLDHIPSADILLRSIYNRLRDLKNLPRKKIDFEPKCKISKANVAFFDQKRRSNRQKRSLKIGGIIGEIELKNVDSMSYNYFKLAEIIGIGKQTSFGMGRIKVKNANANA